MEVAVFFVSLRLFLLLNIRSTLTQLTASDSSGSIRAVKFTVPSQGRGYCPVNLPPGMSTPGRGRTRVECCSTCVQSTDGCLHASFDASNGSCTHFYSTPSQLTQQPNCDFFLNPLKYQGCFGEGLVRVTPGGCIFPFLFKSRQYYSCIPISDSTSSQCITKDGYVADCVVPPGYVAVRSFTLVNNVPVPCITNWFFLMIRAGNTPNFPFDYASYVNGFGNMSGTEFWIGLEAMHQITNAPGAKYRLRVELLSYYTSKWYFAEYSSFSVDSAGTNYTLHVSGYEGDAGDSLANYSLPSDLIHDGMQFSTIDRDNDRNASGSCAEVWLVGWWYNNCIYSCLTGHRNNFCYYWLSLKDLGLDQDGKPRSARMLLRRV